MYDMLPFPNTNGKTTEEQVAEINNYLIQFKESLEFILSNISAENLSQDLIERLNSLGADVEKSSEDLDEQLSQISSQSLTINDVINSPTFSSAVDTKVSSVVDTKLSSAIDTKVSKIKFSVNFETGNLEYTNE